MADIAQAELRNLRTDIYNAASFARPPVGQDRLQQLERPFEEEFELIDIGLPALLHDRHGRLRTRGVVDDEIDRTKSFGDFRHACFDLRLVDGAEAEGAGRSACRGNRFGNPTRSGAIA